MRRLAIVAREARTALGDGPYQRDWIVRGRRWRLRNRGPDAVMGRHGGGWDREVGIQLGSRGLQGTVLVTLWRASLRIDPKGVAR